MCVLLSMGTHCTTCFTPSPAPTSSSTNLTPKENADDMEFTTEPHLISPTSNSSTMNSKYTTNSLRHINEEQEQKHNHNTHYKYTPKRIRTLSKLMHDIPSDTATPTTNTTTSTNTPNTAIPTSSNAPTTASSEDVYIEIYSHINGKQRDTERLSKPIPFDAIFNKIKQKKNTKRHDDGPEYTKATSIETNTTASSIKTSDILYDPESTKPADMDDDNVFNDSDNEHEDDDDDSDTPGPPPKLLLFNNSNRPPVHARKRSSDSSLNGYNESISTNRDNVHRLALPPLASLNHSVSAFDELGKKLNRLPSFQRTLGSASITSLGSMHSQSIHGSFENTLKSLKLRDNMPSFHSLKSFRTLSHTHSVDPFNVTPITHSQQHPQPSFDIIHSQQPRVSQTPSLPSISANDVLAGIDNANLPSKNMSNEAKHMLLHSHRSQSIDSMKHINPLDLIQKRVLFVSIVQLHRSYLNGIPSFVLEHAVFAFGVKRTWIFPKTAIDIKEANESFVAHFRDQWSKEFIQMIESKDTNGHVLWIEPCITSKARIVWEDISDQLIQIVDLSVPEEDTNRRRKEVELHKKQLWMEQKQQKEQEIEEDDEIVSRFPSDRTDSIPCDVPTMYVTSNTLKSFNNSLQTIEDEDDDHHDHKKQLSIAETLLTIHHSKEDALKIGAFDTVYMTDQEEDDAIQTDSDYDDDDDMNVPTFDTETHKSKVLDISLTNMKQTTPTLSKPDKTRASHRDMLIIHNNRRKDTKKMIISIEDTSKQNVIEVDECEYLPYYNKLRLDNAWWRHKYEPVRRSQSDQEKRALAESAKLISVKQAQHPLSHYNENISIYSLFNVEGEAVVKQLRCVSSASDIKLKVLKELFYQSNPTLIPMEYFHINKYMEYHMDIDQKYYDILAYCERYLVVSSTTITPSTSSHNSSNKHVQSNIALNTKGKAHHNVFDHDPNNTDMPQLDDDDDIIEAFGDGFELIPEKSSNRSMGAKSTSLDVISEVNVDDSGMVWMMGDYDDVDDDEDDDYSDDESMFPGCILLRNGSIIAKQPHFLFQSSVQSIKSDSALPFNGKLRGGGSQSSVQLFDD